MDWLTDWDDLVHGTLVFAVALPFAVAVAASLSLSHGRWWTGGAAALLAPYLWFFGLPGGLPTSSDDAAVAALLATAAGVALRRPLVRWCVVALLLGVVTAVIYPAWLATEGGLGRRVLVAAAVGGSAGALAWGGGKVTATGASGVSLAAIVPPLIGLSVLLLLGGAGRFAQSVGAVVAVLSGWLLVSLMKRAAVADEGRGAGMAVALAVFLGWCGWLFAELHYGLAALLLLAPLGALLLRRCWGAEDSPWKGAIRDAAGAGLLTAVPVGVAVAGYLRDSSGGY